MMFLRTQLSKWWPALLMGVASLPIGYGVLALETNSTGFTQWLPDQQLEKRQYAWFVDQFGDDDFLFVSWPGCTLDDQRLARWADALRKQDSAGSAIPSIRQVWTGPEIVHELQQPPLNLSRDEAVRRVGGIFVGSDQKTTGAIVQLTEFGKRSQQTVVEQVAALAESECGLDPNALRMGGSVFEAVEIEKETRRSLRVYAIPVFLVTCLLTALCFRSLPLVVIVLTCAAFCRCLSLALVYFSGGTLSAVLIVMPVLIYVLTISGAVHLVNYYHDAIREGGLATAARRAFQVGWLPCALAAGTTAIGLCSLCVSQIPPIRMFGLYSAAGLLISVVILLAFVPWALQILARRRLETKEMSPNLGVTEPQITPGNVEVAENGGRATFPGFVESAAEFVIRHARSVSVAFLVIGILSIVGLLRTETTIKLERMFVPQSSIVRNYRWIETNIGPLVSVEIIPRFGESCQLDPARRMDLVAEVERCVRDVPEVGGCLSTLTFLPPIPEAEGMQNAVRRRLLAKSVELQNARLTSSGFLARSGGEELWRISARVPAMQEVNLEETIGRIQSRVEKVIQSRQEDGVTGLSVTYTGLLPMIESAQQQLLDDLVNSFLLAVLLICPVMMLILRGVISGLLSMIPNTIPAVIVFGGMGWLRIPVDVGAVLTASVALGIAVDDTLHLLTWFARGLQDGLSRTDAIRNAYRRCAGAMIQTTLICGLGLLVLAHSSFVPTQRFAWLILLLLLAALVGDLLLLPALLAGPLGKFFARGCSVRETKTDQSLACLPRP